jgi:hypothetical protein
MTEYDRQHTCHAKEIDVQVPPGGRPRSGGWPTGCQGIGFGDRPQELATIGVALRLSAAGNGVGSLLVSFAKPLKGSRWPREGSGDEPPIRCPAPRGARDTFASRIATD